MAFRTFIYFYIFNNPTFNFEVPFLDPVTVSVPLTTYIQFHFCEPASISSLISNQFCCCSRVSSLLLTWKERVQKPFSFRHFAYLLHVFYQI